jgi:hypothetical protein
MLLKNDKCFIMMSNFCYSNSGQVRKTLSIKAHADGTGYLISLGKNSICSCLLFSSNDLNLLLLCTSFAFCMNFFCV